MYTLFDKGNVMKIYAKKCPECDGQGYHEDQHRCEYCDGSGIFLDKIPKCLYCKDKATKEKPCKHCQKTADY